MDQLATILTGPTIATASTVTASTLTVSTVTVSTVTASTVTGPPGFESDEDEDYKQSSAKNENLKTENTFCHDTVDSKWIALENNQSTDYTQSTNINCTIDEVHHALHLNCELVPESDDMVIVTVAKE